MRVFHLARLGPHGPKLANEGPIGLQSNIRDKSASGNSVKYLLNSHLENLDPVIFLVTDVDEP